MSEFRRAVMGLLRVVPEGRVVTYGQIAALAGKPNGAREVGYVLAALPEETDIPWHRVVNVRGEVSRRSVGAGIAEGFQRHLLEEEGVVFGSGGRLDLRRYLWEPGRGGRTHQGPRLGHGSVSSPEAKGGRG